MTHLKTQRPRKWSSPKSRMVKLYTSNPSHFAGAVTDVVMSIFTMNFNVLIPVLAKDTLGLQAKGYGYLMSAMGIGAITGAICLAFVSHLGPRWYI